VIVKPLEVANSKEPIQLKENLPMARTIAGGSGNLKRADRGLDYDAYHSIHGHAGLIGQKESLTRFVGSDQGDAVSQEGRQLGEPSNIPGLEKIILIGYQLVLAKGGELQSAPKEKGGIPVFS